MQAKTIYTITSVKTSPETQKTLSGAVARAIAIDEEYQPAYGVTIAIGDRDIVTVDSSNQEETLLALYDEAEEAGDRAMCRTCDAAKRGDAEALVRCYVAIAEAEVAR